MFITIISIRRSTASFYQHEHHSYWYSIFLTIITIGSGSTSIMCRHDFHHHDYLADSSERNIEWSVSWHPLYTGLPLMALPWTISHIAVVINIGACPQFLFHHLLILGAQKWCGYIFYTKHLKLQFVSTLVHKKNHLALDHLKQLRLLPSLTNCHFFPRQLGAQTVVDAVGLVPWSRCCRCFKRWKNLSLLQPSGERNSHIPPNWKRKIIDSEWTFQRSYVSFGEGEVFVINCRSFWLMTLVISHLCFWYSYIVWSYDFNAVHQLSAILRWCYCFSDVIPKMQLVA